MFSSPQKEMDMEANPAGPDVVKQEIIASEMDPEIPKIYLMVCLSSVGAVTLRFS